MIALLNRLLGRDAFEWIFHLSDLYLFLILSIVTITASTIIVIISKKFILFKLQDKDNAVIANIGLIIGMIYAVLVSVMVLYLNTVNTDTSKAVLREANAAATLYRYNHAIANPTQTQITTTLKSYLHEVINEEWPLMEAGQDIDHRGDLLIDDIADQLNHYKINGMTEYLVIHNMLEEVSNLYKWRQERIQMSYSELSPETWEVILIGTILIMGFTYLFKVNVYIHLAAVGAFALMASSTLFLLVTLDRPFQGEFIVEPDSLRTVLTYIDYKEQGIDAKQKNWRISK